MCMVDDVVLTGRRPLPVAVNVAESKFVENQITRQQNQRTSVLSHDINFIRLPTFTFSMLHLIVFTTRVRVNPLSNSQKLNN